MFPFQEAAPLRRHPPHIYVRLCTLPPFSAPVSALKALKHLVCAPHGHKTQKWTQHKRTCRRACFVSRRDAAADSRRDLPHHRRHPGLLHGPGPHAWNGGAAVHRGEWFWTSALFVRLCLPLCTFVCAPAPICVFCVWPWAAVDGLRQLGVARFTALSHLAYVNTHTHTCTRSTLFMETIPVSCKTTFLYIELFLTSSFVFLLYSWLDDPCYLPIGPSGSSSVAMVTKTTRKLLTYTATWQKRVSHT